MNLESHLVYKAPQLHIIFLHNGIDSISYHLGNPITLGKIIMFVYTMYIRSTF